jgi:hypothetical protein
MGNENKKDDQTAAREASLSAPICSGVMWVVMKAHTWENIEVMGMSIRPPPDGPQRFIPMFDTREQAVAWDGSDEHVVMVADATNKDHACDLNRDMEGKCFVCGNPQNVKT